MPQFDISHSPKIFNREAAVLAKLQGEVADLVKNENELAELQKQQMKTLHNQLTQGIQKLSSLAEQINALAAQLEVEILNFKNIALETNKVYYAVQQPVDLTIVE